MAMGDRRPSRTSPTSRLTSLPNTVSLSSYSSTAPSATRAMPEQSYAPASMGMSHLAARSPTLTRRPEASPPSLANSVSDPIPFGANTRATASIMLRMLPRTQTPGSLRSLLTFVEDFVDAQFVDSFDPGFQTAIAVFRSVSGAREAQDKLNGKRNETHDANLIVEPYNTSDIPPSFGSRRSTVDGLGSGQGQPSASTASSSSSNHTLSRGPSRYSTTFQTSIDKVSPPLGSPTATHKDFPQPTTEESSVFREMFSPQSPIGNKFLEGPRVSGKSLINNDMAEEESGNLLNEAVGFPNTRNGRQPVSRRPTNPAIPTAQFGSLSLNTSLSNGSGHGLTSPSDASLTSPRTYQMMQSPPAVTPTAGQPRQNGYHFNKSAMPAANPADQNPPCNTLYVGNLPPNSQEDELKALFCRQRGYKRLCFRTKHNGPMCFVEFEDVGAATRALHSLYGVCLTNSVKGGIRLSYSKNPLGVRREQLNGSGPGSPLTSSGMSNGFGSSSGAASFTSANGPPPGLPLPALHSPPGAGFGAHQQSEALQQRGYGIPQDPNYSSGVANTQYPRLQRSPGGYQGQHMNAAPNDGGFSNSMHYAATQAPFSPGGRTNGYGSNSDGSGGRNNGYGSNPNGSGDFAGGR